MTSEQAQHVKEQAVRLTCVADAELVEVQSDDFAVRIELLDGSHELTSTVVVDAYTKIQRIKATYLGDTLRFAVPGQNGEAVACDRETWRNWQNASGAKQTMEAIQDFGEAKGTVWFCGVSDTLDGPPRFWEAGFLDSKDKPIWPGEVFETRELAINYIKTYIPRGS
jgi:hypothetical protein